MYITVNHIKNGIVNHEYGMPPTYGRLSLQRGEKPGHVTGNYYTDASGTWRLATLLLYTLLYSSRNHSHDRPLFKRLGGHSL